jgi:hypothetical protein
MLLIFTITLPLFVLVLAVYLSAWRGLTGFVFYFALPLMLFYNHANAPIAAKFNSIYALAYLGSGLTVHLAGFFISRWLFKCDWSERAIQGIAVSFGNTVFIALPITNDLFGEAANLPLATAITIENGILMPFTIALLEIGKAGHGAIWQASGEAVKAILRNPIVMSVLLGSGDAGTFARLRSRVAGYCRHLCGRANGSECLFGCRPVRSLCRTGVYRGFGLNCFVSRHAIRLDCRVWLMRCCSAIAIGPHHASVYSSRTPSRSGAAAAS